MQYKKHTIHALNLRLYSKNHKVVIMKKHKNKSHIKKEKIDKYKKIDLAALRPA